jgi:hypothetical protein
MPPMPGTPRSQRQLQVHWSDSLPEPAPPEPGPPADSELEAPFPADAGSAPGTMSVSGAADGLGMAELMGSPFWPRALPLPLPDEVLLAFKAPAAGGGSTVPFWALALLRNSVILSGPPGLMPKAMPLPQWVDWRQ